MASKSKGIVVLGMHRAGTSATGNILVDLGFEMPGESVPADDDNPKGYWEPREIVEIHDAFLHGIGRCWSDPRPMDPQAFESEAAEVARKSLRAVAQESLLPKKRWVIKDPRMCRLMPLWSEVLQQGGFDLRFLHVLRSPLSVADSLYRRDKFSQEKSFLLWLRHNLEAEIATRDLTRSWLNFEEVKAAPADEVNKRFRSATGQSRLSGKRIQGAIAEVLELSLLHSDHSYEDSLEQLADYPWVATAYRALTSLSLNGGKSGQSELDELRPQIVKADAFKFGDPEFWGPQLVNERLHWLRESIENQRREIHAQRAEVDALRSSFEGEREAQISLKDEIESKYSNLLPEISALAGLRDELMEWARHQVTVADQRQQGIESLRSSVDIWVREQVTSQDRQRRLVESLHETLDKWGRRQTELDDQRRLVTDTLLEKLNDSLGAVGARIHQLEEQGSTLDKAIQRSAAVGDQSQELIRESLNSLGGQRLQLQEVEAKLGDFGHWIGEIKAGVGQVARRDELGDVQRAITRGQESLAAAIAQGEAKVSSSVLQSQESLAVILAGAREASTRRHEDAARRQHELARSQDEMTQRQGEMTHRQGDMAERQIEMAQRQVDLAQTQDEVNQRQGEMAHRQGEMARSQEELAKSQGEMVERQNAMTRRQEEVVGSLAVVREGLSTGDQRQLRVTESLTKLEVQVEKLVDSRGTLDEQGESLATVADGVSGIAEGVSGIADGFSGIADGISGIADGISGIEQLIVDKLEHKHLALLSKSLEVSAVIEDRWKTAREEVASIERQRDAMLAERDRIRLTLDIAQRERDAAIQARDAAAQGRDAALSERRAVIEGRDVALVEQSRIFAAELDQAREESQRLQQERDAARTEIEQMLGRFSWKLTAPLRAVLKGLKSLRP
ncbi:MAG: hypothetical protein AAF560_01020 [Acidobacteriota bacterium]